MDPVTESTNRANRLDHYEAINRAINETAGLNVDDALRVRATFNRDGYKTAMTMLDGMRSTTQAQYIERCQSHRREYLVVSGDIEQDCPVHRAQREIKAAAAAGMWIGDYEDAQRESFADAQVADLRNLLAGCRNVFLMVFGLFSVIYLSVLCIERLAGVLH